ncbi:DUF4142 domain-containing protein [Hymenobacter humi]|uniref:DUF4142 domain-containing protein n=1 Tax=Hymenobacter humi TaxID=1411620 RepID=A0ABW2UAN5_9BACT
MKTLSHFLVVCLLLIGTACSSTKTGANADGTAESAAMGARTGTDMNPTPAPDANAGVAPSGAAGTGTDASTDVTAFMATFATMQDPVFLMNAASSNMLEVRAGQMAAQKATRPDVRKFAQMMVSHHSSSTQEVKAVAMPLGVKMPQTMLPVHQALADQLMNKSGKNFDEAYMDLMETAHKLDVAMFEVKSKAAENPSVQTFAANNLPVLQSHLTMASELEKRAD